VSYHFGRDDDVDDSVVKWMGEIDDTVEVGVFADIAWNDAANPRNRFIVGATLLQDIGNESDGFRARLVGAVLAPNRSRDGPAFGRWLYLCG
jgi:hypothetical protein